MRSTWTSASSMRNSMIFRRTIIKGLLIVLCKRIWPFYKLSLTKKPIWILLMKVWRKKQINKVLPMLCTVKQIEQILKKCFSWKPMKVKLKHFINFWAKKLKWITSMIFSANLIRKQKETSSIFCDKTYQRKSINTIMKFQVFPLTIRELNRIPKSQMLKKTSMNLWKQFKMKLVIWKILWFQVWIKKPIFQC